MEIGTTDPAPDLDDLLQEEVQVPTVPVRIEGQVLTHELPTRRAQMKTDVVPITTWTALLPETVKRKRLVLLSSDSPFYVSTDGTGTTGMIWPANVPLTLTHTQKIYVMSAHAANTAMISHVSELWAD